MCSELTPRARIPDTRIPQFMQPWTAADCDSRCNPLLQRPPVPKPANLSDAPKLLAKSVTRQTPSPSFKIIFGCFDFNSVRMIAFISALIIDKDDQDDRWTCQMIKQDEQDDQNENGRRTWQQARGRRSGQPAPRGWVQGTWNGTLPNSYVQGAQISDVFLLPKCITLSWEKGDDGKQLYIESKLHGQTMLCSFSSESSQKGC